MRGKKIIGSLIFTFAMMLLETSSLNILGKTNIETNKV